MIHLLLGLLLLLQCQLGLSRRSDGEMTCLYDEVNRLLPAVFFKEARREGGLAEMDCELHLTALMVPQPSDSRFGRLPHFVTGLTCVGKKDPEKVCSPRKTTTIQHVVSLFKYNSSDQMIGSNGISDTVEFTMPIACEWTRKSNKITDLCSKVNQRKFLDANNICRCVAPKKCRNLEVWDEAACSCYCSPSMVRCEDKFTLDLTECRCIPNNGCLQSVTCPDPTVKPILAMLADNQSRCMCPAVAIIP